MAQQAMKTTVHSNHPAHPHPLEEQYSGTEFICDGCKTRGTGTRYRCHNCDFDLHEYCQRCPISLDCFLHPHPLDRKAQGSRQNETICDVCEESVEGTLFYRCEDCDFDVHPLCTQLPQHRRHALHTANPLMLETKSSSSLCAVCGDPCNSWRYRCGICCFDIHVKCISTSCDHSSTQRLILPCRPPPPCNLPCPRPPPCNTYTYVVNQFQPCDPPPPLPPPPPPPPQCYGVYAYRPCGSTRYDIYRYNC